MNYNIFGSGFGLYAYLPAILRNKKNKVFLPKKYFSVIVDREDLKKYLNNIIWYSKISDIREKIHYCIIAKRPNDQTKLLNKITEFRNLRHLYLEKPLAKNYYTSQKLLKFLKKKKINFSICYLINETPIYGKLTKIINNKTVNKINIYWSLKKINKNKSWKFNKKEGGGILNFYGIHFIHLFSTLGFNNVLSSRIVSVKGKDVSWEVNVMKYSVIINLKMNIKTHKNLFLIDIIKNNKKINLIKYQNPFIKNINKFKKGINEDYRTKFLVKYLNNNKKNKYNEYIKTNILWERIQKKTIKY